MRDFRITDQRVDAQFDRIGETPLGIDEQLPTVLGFDQRVIGAELGRASTQVGGDIAAQQRTVGVCGKPCIGRARGPECQERGGVAAPGIATLRIDRIRLERELAIDRQEFAAMLVARCGEEAKIGGFPPERQRTVEIAGRPFDELVVARCEETILVGAGNEVYHTRNGIGSIRRGSAILEHFDPADRGERDQIDVHRWHAVARSHKPTAVEQHQRAPRPKPAQVYRGNAFGALRARIELVRVAEHAARGGQCLQDFERARRTLLGKVFGRDHLDRQRAGFLGALDQGPGDDDFGRTRIIGGRRRGRLRQGLCPRDAAG